MAEPDQHLDSLSETSERPTRARWIVLAFLCGLSSILYMDRICFSKAVTPLQEELGLDKSQLGSIMLAFTIAYGIFEVPIGRWGDRTGARRVLTRIALSWSLFTALTGACFGFWQLVVVRFLFGAGEAGAYPNTARIFSRWFSDAERARAQGLVLACAQVGSIVAMPVAGYLVEWGGWRTMFVTFGTLGVFWAIAFYLWFRDDPAQHKAVNAAERRLIGETRAKPVSRHDPIPWGLVSVNRSIWLLASIMVFGAFYSYFYYSWFPNYLEEARGLTNLQSGWLTALPYVGTTGGTLLGGAIAGWAFRDPDRRDRAVNMVGGLSYLLAAVSLWIAIRCDDPVWLVSIAAISCASFASVQPLWWSCAIAVTGRHVGSLFGLMNMAGLLGAGASQLFVGIFADWRKSLGYVGRDQWDPIFIVYVVILLAGATCWALYRTRPVEPEETASPE